MKGNSKNTSGTDRFRDHSLGRFIDRFDVLLLDMGDTFMFDVDRFDIKDGLYTTYLNFGGSAVRGSEVHQILSDVFQGLIADGKIPENYEKFLPVSSYLKRHPSAESLPADELDILERTFTEHEIGTIPDKYIEIIKQLSKTHRLGIISDIWSHSKRFYKELDEVGLKDLFEVIVFSSDIGIIKPSPRIFLKALGALSTDISKAVYIGDSLRRDVTGAKNIGMSAVWINTEQHAEQELNVQPDLIVTDLQDILN